MPRIGVLSDTHGLLRPEAKRFLAGSDAIIHAGDIGRAEILEELSSIAPLTAVRGNNDRGAWAQELPETELLRIGAIAVLVLHDVAELGTRAAAAGARVVVTGHSHKPGLREEDGVLHLNPGSAGPRRFKLPVSLAELMVSGDSVTARIVELAVATKR
ncbi:MAG TPA: metallophosphoesterase family protein [Alphaproteobacteria bacterium]